MRPLATLRDLFSCRLCWMIALAVFLLILVVESVILVPSAQRFERNELDRLADQAVIAVEPVLVVGTVANGEKSSTRELGVLVGQYRLAGLALYGPNGTLVMRAGEHDGLGYPENAANLVSMMAEQRGRSADGKRIDVAWRSTGSGEPVVVARLDSSHVGGALFAYMLRVGGLVAIIVLVVTAGTMLVLHLWVLRPLLTLRQSALAAGADPDQADRHMVRTRRRDEMGDVLRAHDAMLERVADSKRRDRALAEERTRFLSHHDALTGLPNRAALIEFLDRCRDPRRAAGQATLYLVNLLQFRALNANVGPRRGDELLRQFAARLTRAAGSGDLVAHLGADRFAIAHAGAVSTEDDAGFAERILSETKRAYDLGGVGTISIAVRVGIANASLADVDGPALLSQAEFALSRTRAEDGGEYQFFSARLAEEASARQSLTRDLEQAIQAGEFFPVYQPKMSLAADGSAKIAGAEALLRWRSPSRGMVGAGEFIPLAEATGLIVPIGEFAIRAVCAQIREWLDRHGWSPRVAVNLSARQFGLPDLKGHLEHMLAESRVPANLLEVEVTETAAMRDVASTAATIAELRALGVRVSIDDFGSGYSSLSYLHRFAVDAIKIDKSFIDGIGSDRHAEAICDAVLRLGQALGTRVIAEGVENAGQLEFLRRRKCDEVQGYYLGRPVAAADFEQTWVAARAAA